MRLYTGTDDQSHFEELEVPFEPRDDLGLFTLPEPVKVVFFREIPRNMNMAGTMINKKKNTKKNFSNYPPQSRSMFSGTRRPGT
jgi:hypothetical protein